MKRITLTLGVAILTFTFGVVTSQVFKYYSLFASEGTRPTHPDVCIPRDRSVSFSVIDRSWNGVLGWFDEMPFADLPSCVDESYRVVWIPTFHAPVSIRVWRSGENLFMVSKKLSGKGGYTMGHLEFQELRPISDVEWNEFRRLLRVAGYYDLATIDPTFPPNDGAEWVIESMRNGDYHKVDRRAPNTGFREACVYLVKLSGLSTEIEQY